MGHRRRRGPALPQVKGARTAKVNFLDTYVAKLHIAAERHPTVGTAFLSVANLMAPPTALFRPAILAHVLRPGHRNEAWTTMPEREVREPELTG